MWLSGCSSDSPTVGWEEHQLGQAYLHMQHNQPDEATLILEELIATNPYNREGRMALASSYLAKAGLSFDKFMGLARTLEETDSDREIFERYSAPAHYLQRQGGEDGKRLAALMMAYNRGIYVFDRVIRSIEQVPAIDGHQASSVEMAIETLNQSPDVDRGMSLFRAVLRIVLLKYNWDQRKYFEVIHDCSDVEVSHLQGGFRDLVVDLEEFVEDLKNGLPRRSDEFVRVQRALHQIGEGFNQQDRHTLRSEVPLEMLVLIEAVLPEGARCI